MPESAKPKRRLAEVMRLPLVSGKVSVLALILCFALTAVFIPMAARLPVWIELEIVLAVWWLLWAITLSYLLHRGYRLSDDYQRRPPRSWFSKSSASGESATERKRSFWDWIPFDIPAVGDGEGCALALLVLIAIPLLIGAAWLLIEIAIPVGAFLLYCLLWFMLARIVNDRHNCQESWARSAFWGVLWATVYTAPLAGIVWLVHYVAAK